MTFILNVLNKDFSLIAADKRANANGPTTIKMGDLTIHSENGATINGVKKIHTNNPASFAIGIAGTIQDHHYVSDIESSTDIDQGLLTIRTHMEGFLNVNNRSQILEKKSRMENQGIATFFCPETSGFFSNLYLFTDLHNHTRLYSNPENGAQLFHVGSGSSRFEEAVGLEEIQTFARSISGLDNIEYCLSWLKDAFSKVSSIEDSVGDEFTAMLSTREDPIFKTITG